MQWRRARQRPAALVAIWVTMAAFIVFPTERGGTAGPAFTFAASGDLGGGWQAQQSLMGAAALNPAFFLALGDLSYNDIKPEKRWCDWVTATLGPATPLQIIAGNHESQGENGKIANFAGCLPNRMPGMVGTYAKQYFFDYPLMDPVARVIAISPGLSFPGEAMYDYMAPARRAWLEMAIRDARADGIPWVIVAMHKPCLTAGNYRCDIGAGLMNLLVREKVDLVLQGHEHGYQRSKQLALSPACPSLTTGTYNAGCVADGRSTGTYAKGAGTVFAVSGAFHDLRALKKADPEAPYFCKLMGTNLTPTHGFLKFDVSTTRLQASFVQTDAGAFSDNFAIGNGATPATGQ
jgi:hypothetical protein